MTNLPITPRSPQSVATPPPANATGASDAQNSQPFGEVLAREMKEPNAKDVNAADKKVTVDGLVQIGVDTKDDKKPDITIGDVATGLPAAIQISMLLPQTTTTTTTKLSAENAVDTGQGKHVLASLKADVSSAAQPAIDAKVPSEIPFEGLKKEIPVATGLTATPSAQNIKDFESILSSRDIPATQTGPQPNLATLVASQNATANIAAQTLQPITNSISTPLAHDKWGDEFSQKITWLATSNQDQSAELHLNPPQLGPLDVVIKVSGDQATALFTSPHAAVRDAIEQAMPKLRDMLADNGITLGNATVSDQAPREQNQPNAPRSAGTTDNEIRDTSIMSNSTVRVSQISRHNGIVDTFA